METGLFSSQGCSPLRPGAGLGAWCFPPASPAAPVATEG